MVIILIFPILFYFILIASLHLRMKVSEEWKK